jgi:hypothetical protein
MGDLFRDPAFGCSIMYIFVIHVQPAIRQGWKQGDWWTYLGPRIIIKCLYFSLYTTSPDSISLAICVFIHVKQYTIEKYAIAVSTPTQEGYTKLTPRHTPPAGHHLSTHGSTTSHPNHPVRHWLQPWDTIHDRTQQWSQTSVQHACPAGQHVVPTDAPTHSTCRAPPFHPWLHHLTSKSPS